MNKFYKLFVMLSFVYLIRSIFLNVKCNMVLIRSSSFRFIYDDFFGGFLMVFRVFNDIFGDFLDGFNFLGLRL